MSDYSPDLFKGTARYYIRYRVPYPDELFEDLRKRSGISGTGRLLDLATGPGRIALPLSPFFKEVWAVDQEPEMIEAGEEEARQRGIENIQWIVTRAEDTEAPNAWFELITIGEAFHRLDQDTIIRRAREWLLPGRYLATLGCDTIFKGQEDWVAVVVEVVNRWIETDVSNPPPDGRPGLPPAGEEKLRTAGLDVYSREFRQPYVWTAESITGNLYSTSIASKRVLGQNSEAFEAELRDALMDYDPRGKYPATLSFGYTLARMPMAKS